MSKERLVKEQREENTAQTEAVKMGKDVSGRESRQDKDQFLSVTPLKIKFLMESPTTSYQSANAKGYETLTLV